MTFARLIEIALWGAAFERDATNEEYAEIRDFAKTGRNLHDVELDELELQKRATADMVAVVRCKDCKHWDASDVHSTICPNNRRCKGIIGKMYTAPDYYCAYGERKDG